MASIVTDDDNGGMVIGVPATVFVSTGTSTRYVTVLVRARHELVTQPLKTGDRAVLIKWSLSLLKDEVIVIEN
jgi:hypothetical protein